MDPKDLECTSHHPTKTLCKQLRAITDTMQNPITDTTQKQDERLSCSLFTQMEKLIAKTPCASQAGHSLLVMGHHLGTDKPQSHLGGLPYGVSPDHAGS